jgi:hypothetical protein
VEQPHRIWRGGHGHEAYEPPPTSSATPAVRRALRRERRDDGRMAGMTDDHEARRRLIGSGVLWLQPNTLNGVPVR